MVLACYPPLAKVLLIISADFLLIISML